MNKNDVTLKCIEEIVGDLKYSQKELIRFVLSKQYPSDYIIGEEDSPTTPVTPPEVQS